jgi:hypothetical protein
MSTTTSRLAGPSDDLVQPCWAGNDCHGARLQPAHVEQVFHQMGEPVEGFISGGEEFVAVLVGPLDVRRPQAGDGSFGRGERRAQVMADRGQQCRAHPVGFGDGARRLCFGGKPLLLQRDRGVGGEGAEHSAVGGGKRRATQGQGEVAGDRHLDVGFLWPGRCRLT